MKVSFIERIPHGSPPSRPTTYCIHFLDRFGTLFFSLSAQAIPQACMCVSQPSANQFILFYVTILSSLFLHFDHCVRFSPYLFLSCQSVHCVGFMLVQFHPAVLFVRKPLTAFCASFCILLPTSTLFPFCSLLHCVLPTVLFDGESPPVKRAIIRGHEETHGSRRYACP